MIFNKIKSKHKLNFGKLIMMYHQKLSKSSNCDKYHSCVTNKHTNGNTIRQKSSSNLWKKWKKLKGNKYLKAYMTATNTLRWGAVMKHERIGIEVSILIDKILFICYRNRNRNKNRKRSRNRESSSSTHHNHGGFFLHPIA